MNWFVSPLTFDDDELERFRSHQPDTTGMRFRFLARRPEQTRPYRGCPQSTAVIHRMRRYEMNAAPRPQGCLRVLIGALARDATRPFHVSSSSTSLSKVWRQSASMTTATTNRWCGDSIFDSFSDFRFDKRNCQLSIWSATNRKNDAILTQLLQSYRLSNRATQCR